MGDEVIVEQLGRLSDRMEARFDHVETLLVHHQELDDERHRALNEVIKDMKKVMDDHEQRLRSASEAATQFKVWSGGSGLMSIAAIVRSFFGG